MAFQSELVELLEAFSLRSPEDFARLPPDQQHYFASRLYKCFRTGAERLSQELESRPGLKLAFRHDPQKLAQPVEDVFLRKLAFYCSHFVVSCPVEEVTSTAKPSNRKRMESRERLDAATLKQLRKENKLIFGDVIPGRKTYGGELHVKPPYYVIRRETLWQLVALTSRLKEAIRVGVVNLIPRLPGEERRIDAALSRAKVARANFSRQSLVRQFSEENLDVGVPDARLTNIYLPHLTNVPLEALIELRQEEAEAYAKFQNALASFVLDAGNSFSESKLEDYLRVINDGVLSLVNRFKVHKKRLYSVYRGVGLEAVGVALIAFVGPELRPFLGGFLGALSAHLVRIKMELEAAEVELTGDPFYVAWKLGNK